MSQVNKYTDRAAYEADESRLADKSAVSFIESDNVVLYDGANVVVDKPAAAIGDLAVFDKTDEVIRFVKGATLRSDTLPASLAPLAVVYARQGDRLQIVALDNATGNTVRWAHPYQVALSGFDLTTGGTFSLRISPTLPDGDVSVAYAAGSTLPEIAADTNAALRVAAHNYTSPDYGGWSAVADEDGIVMTSNTYSVERAQIEAVEGVQIRRAPEDVNYQTTLTGVLIEGQSEWIRRKNGVDIQYAGCSPEQFLKYYSAYGTNRQGLKPGSSVIIRESVFTEADNPELIAAYPTYRDYLFSEQMAQYPSAYGAMLRYGKTNTEKIGRLRFIDIRGESVYRYPAAAAALEYGVAVEGASTGLEAGAWWLPSVNEIYQLMHERVQTAADVEKDPVNRTLSRLGKATCYAADQKGFYTSCECRRSNAFCYAGSNGVIGESNYKYGLIYARPVSAL